MEQNRIEINKEKQIEEMAKISCNTNNSEIKWVCAECPFNTVCDIQISCEALYNAGYRKIPQNIGEFSDGYHTFNELYHHRAVLFSVICNMFPEKSWKSKLHDTGDMYDGMFIVGIETEQGQATYHYDIEPYWDMFKVKELEKAPKYDGHTPSDAIKRIGNLTCAGYRKQSEWISVDERLPEEYKECLVAAKVGDKMVIDIGERVRSFNMLTNSVYLEWLITNDWNEGQGCEITHWMPLPEAPKMKGGAE